MLWGLNQGFVLAKQTHYHLSHAAAPHNTLSVGFPAGVFCLAWSQRVSDPSVSALHVAGSACMYHHTWPQNFNLIRIFSWTNYKVTMEKLTIDIEHYQIVNINY
jgi:hypothetical protein